MAESYLKLAKVYSLLGSKYLGLNVQELNLLYVGKPSTKTSLV